MEYQKIIQKIQKKRRFQTLPGVEISKQILAALDRPDRHLAFIHIAGTNGKGSTAAFLCSVLREAGIKTGLFTSPHLIDFTERIQVDGTQIPKNKAAEIGERLLGLKLDVEPSMFDYCFVMALLYFKEQRCQIVILETGLGGRLDSTNAIETPLVSILTKVGYDHTEILGNSLEEIASEKAGILKKGTRAVLESQYPEVSDVFRQTCKRLDIPFCEIIPSQIVSQDGGFSYPNEKPYQTKLLGKFQKENALAAVLAARELIKLGYPVKEEALHRGIAHAVWSGRMEVVCQNPFLLIDGAHNENGVAALAESLKMLYPNETFHFIMGVLADKEYEKMAEIIVPLAEKVTTVTPESARALSGEKLEGYLKHAGVKAENKTNISEVFQPFLSQGDKKFMGTRTVAFGSLYFIGEIKEFFSQH